MTNKAMTLSMLLAGLFLCSRHAQAECTGYDCHGNPIATSVIGQTVCGPDLMTWVCEDVGSYFGFAETGGECSCPAVECPSGQVFTAGYGCMCPDGGPLDAQGNCAGSDQGGVVVGGTVPPTWTLVGGGSSSSSTVSGTVTWTQTQANPNSH